MRRVVIVIVALVGLAIASPASGGGTWMESTEKSYQPGDSVKAVGYVGSEPVERPYIARLNLVPIQPATEYQEPRWHELGPVTVEHSGLQGYLAYRVSIEFTVPADLPPGEFTVEVHNENGAPLGDLIGLWLFVGIEPAYPPNIEWPLDEPLIAELPDDAVIAGPGFAVPVAELRAGQYPPGAEEFMLHPETLPDVRTETFHQEIPLTESVEVFSPEAGLGDPEMPAPISPRGEGAPSTWVPAAIVFALLVLGAAAGAGLFRRRPQQEEAPIERQGELERAGR